MVYRDPHNEYIDAIQNWTEFLGVLDAWMDTTDRYLWAESAPELFSHTGRYGGWARVLAKWILDNTKIPPDVILKITRAIQAKDPLGDMAAFAMSQTEIEKLLVEWRPYQQLLVQQAEAADVAGISEKVGGPMPAFALEAMVGDEGRRILEIARTSDTADEKMRRICGIDRGYLYWKSTQWAGLLGVKPPAIRKTKFWKEDRRLAIDTLASMREDEETEIEIAAMKKYNR